MKYRFVTRPDRQGGFSIIIAVVIVVVISLLVASMFRFTDVETQAASTELIGERAFYAASSLAEFGIRRLMLEEKPGFLYGTVGLTKPIECEDVEYPNTSSSEYFHLLAPGNPANPGAGDPPSTRWGDPFMGQCNILGLACETRKIGANPSFPEVYDSYHIVAGTVECAVSGGEDTYRARKTVEMEAKLSLAEKLERAGVNVANAVVGTPFCACKVGGGFERKSATMTEADCTPNPQRLFCTQDTGTLACNRDNGGIEYDPYKDKTQPCESDNLLPCEPVCPPPP